MKYIKFLLLIVFVSVFKILNIHAKTNTETSEKCIKSSSKVIFGRIEKGFIKSANAKLTVKMDTGAKTASLDVKKLKYFKKNNEKWVKFTITSRNTRKKKHRISISNDIEIEKPVIDFITIKKHFKNKKVDYRPVINLEIKIGNTTETIKVNLVSRKNFLYPMLFGKEAIIKFNAIIDPQKSFLQKLNHQKHK